MKQKGGSVASDAVTSLVSADTYTKMSAMASNQYSSGQCGGSQSCPTCGGAVRRRKIVRKVKKGGNGMMDSLMSAASKGLGMKSTFVDSPFHSEPAPAYNAVLPRNVGVKDHFVNSAAKPSSMTPNAVSKFMNAAPKHVTGETVPHAGGKKKEPKRKQRAGSMKPLSELMTQNSGMSYSIHNKKGGASDSFGLDYEAVKFNNLPNGNSVNRSIASNEIGNKLLASENVPSMPLIQKFTSFGTPSDTKLPFSFSSDKVSVASAQAGGKKVKRTKTKKSKTVLSKKK